MAKYKKKSLCKLAKAGFPAERTGKYVKLIKKPKFVCLKCGRAAVNKRNLCHPAKIK